MKSITEILDYGRHNESIAFFESYIGVIRLKKRINEHLDNDLEFIHKQGECIILSKNFNIDQVEVTSEVPLGIKIVKGGISGQFLRPDENKELYAKSKKLLEDYGLYLNEKV